MCIAFHNIPSTDPLSLNIVVDQLQERVGELEAAAERTVKKQQQMSLEMERVVADQHKLFWELDRVERQFQLFGRSNSWGPSVTHSAAYSDQHFNTMRLQDSWDDTNYEASYSRPTSPTTATTIVRLDEAPKQVKSPEHSPAAPKAIEIANVNPDNTLPSSVINTKKLVEVKVVIMKYPKLRNISKASTLSVKLAKEAIFGEDVMKQCTVAGTREYPGLPFNELQQLKQIVFERFPQYWKTPFEFEDVWKVCFDAVGQACKRLRK